MSDSASDDGRDDFVLQERLSGRSERSLSKELRCSIAEIQSSLDRALPKINNELRMRYVALDLMRLDELISVFAKRAIEQKDVPSAMLVIKALERRAALVGLDQPTRVDVVQLQTKEAPSGFDRILEAVMRVKYGPNWKPEDGDREPNLPALDGGMPQILLK